MSRELISGTDMITLLELARVALITDSMRDELGLELDLSDAELTRLLHVVNQFMNSEATA